MTTAVICYLRSIKQQEFYKTTLNSIQCAVISSRILKINPSHTTFAESLKDTHLFTMLTIDLRPKKGCCSAMSWDGGKVFDVALLALMQPVHFVVYFLTNPYTVSMTATIIAVAMEVIMTVVLSGATLLLVATSLINEANMERMSEKGGTNQISNANDCTKCEQR